MKKYSRVTLAKKTVKSNTCGLSWSRPKESETLTLEKVKAALQYYRTFSTSERKDFHAAQETAKAKCLREHVETFENNQILLGEFQKGVDEFDQLADTWDKRREDAEEHDFRTVQ